MNRAFRGVLIFLVLLVAILTACGAEKLSSDFDETTVKESTVKVIELLNDKNYDELREISILQMKQALTDDILNEVVTSYIEPAGEFKNINEIGLTETKSNESNEKLATAIAKAEYENGTLTYTITFDKDMQLAGLYVK